MRIFKTIAFEAAHRLPNVPPHHKCARLHGHSYQVDLHVGGPLGNESGWVMDFADVQAAFAPLYRLLDHQYLNEVEGLANPTAEHLALWIWRRLKPGLPGLTEIAVRETPTSGCIYRGEDEVHESVEN